MDYKIAGYHSHMGAKTIWLIRDGSCTVGMACSEYDPPSVLRERAVLFAAAPKMLEALKTIASAGSPDEYDAAMKGVKAAIAAAEGEGVKS